MARNPEGPLALRHANVLTMDGGDGGFLPDRTVVVDGARVVAVAPDGSHTAPVAAEIDVRGGWVVPGLADMHVHMWDAGEANLYLANGVTTVRNMFGAPWHLAFRRLVERRERPGPRMVTTTPLVDGPVPGEGRPMWPGSALLTSASDASEQVERWLARGYDQLKAYSFLTADVLGALGRACQQHGVTMTGHCPDAVTYEQAITAGQRCFEHLTNIEKGHLRGDGELPPRSQPVARARRLCEEIDDASLQRLATELAERDVWNCVTATVWYGLADAFDPAARRSPLLRYVPEATLASWDPANDFRFRALSPADYEDVLIARRLLADRLRDVTALLHEAGAPLLVGTDNPNPYVVPGFSVHDELEHLVRAGSTPLEALAAATVAPARFLGETGRAGVVAEGARADLVVVGADPRLDLSTLRTPTLVLTNGFAFDRGDLDSLLAERAAEVISKREVDPADVPELPPPDGPPRHAGTVRTAIAGASVGCCHFRHTDADDGGIVIEEVAAQGGEARTRRRTHVVLGRGRAIERARSEEEADVGTRVVEVSRSGGRYRISSTDVDGWAEERFSGAVALAPSDRLTMSALPYLTDADAPRVALDADGTTVPISVDGPSVTFHRDDEESRVEIEVTGDGRLSQVRAQTWMGDLVAEVTPAPAP